VTRCREKERKDREDGEENAKKPKGISLRSLRVFFAFSSLSSRCRNQGMHVCLGNRMSMIASGKIGKIEQDILPILPLAIMLILFP